MKNKLSEPTPEFYTILWQIGTFLYALIVFINENTAGITELGLSAEFERYVKIFGLVGYFLFTYFNFNQTKNKK